MPRLRKYSVEEVLNFTVKDIQGPDFVDVKIKGWLELTSEQREQCIAKLRARDLVRQRDEVPQPKAMDASELEDRLNRIERSRSRSWCTPDVSPYNPDDPEKVEKDSEVEREAHEELVRDHGRPCYPIELGLDIFKHPGQYKDIFEYWQGESGVGETTERWIVFLQLERWKKFRQFQQRNRRYFVYHKRFPEFQQHVLERRRRHGLDGDMQLLEEQDKQSKLNDWMEYQDYELRTYDGLQKEFKEDQELLASRRKALAEAGISAFEEVQEFEFASYYTLILESSNEEAGAEKKVESAERKLRLAEKRLKAAGSDDLGESVERATWVKLFRKELESAQMRMDKLQHLAEDAKRELEPHKRWFYDRQIEWEKRRLDDPEEGERMTRLECDSAEHQDRMKKLAQLGKVKHEAGMAHFRAEKEMEFAEEVYDAARLDNFGETVKRSVLIQMAQREVQSAQTQVEEAKEPLEKIKLKGKVISALSSIPLTRRKIKRHEVLLEWIERQRQEIAGGRADLKKEGGQSQSKVSSRVLRNYPATEASRLNKSPKVNVRQRKQSTARSILSPVDPAKVSKVYSKKRSSRRQLSVSCDPPQAAAEMTIDSTAPKPRSKRAFKVKDAMPASLRPIHSSGICKPSRKRLTGPHRGSTRQKSNAAV
ncbi:MAG: hypothetical protein L6R40_008341 [Gallowayella cf. fulva]|nr:MAG: hypothetical protein L6R40_008341 [Xanthomendoza cf. fulva]